MMTLAKKTREALADDEIAGVLITHGTDTMEETAYFLDLVIDGKKPVVLTGSQIPAVEPGSDGPRNLMDAVRSATSEKTHELGTIIAFNGELHCSREAFKSHTSAVETFRSLYGPLGVVDGNDVIIFRRPTIREYHPISRVTARVDLIKMATDVDRRFFDASIDSGIDGIVIEATGRGHVTKSSLPGLNRAIQSGIPVVVASRCVYGRAFPAYGGFDGSGTYLRNLGAIYAGDLSGQKARIKLVVLLSETRDKAKIQEAFEKDLYPS
jgi:L-asparaginase